MALQGAKVVAKIAGPTSADQVSVNVPGSAEVVGPPRVTFEDAVRDFAIDVLAAASYREASARGSTSEEVQYTSAYFEGAKIQVRNAGYVPKTPRWHPFAKIGSPLAFVLTGVAFPMMFADEAWPGWGPVAGGSLVVGVGLAAMVEFWKVGER